MLPLPGLVEPSEKLRRTFSITIHKCNFFNHWLRWVSTSFTILPHNLHSPFWHQGPSWSRIFWSFCRNHSANKSEKKVYRKKLLKWHAQSELACWKLCKVNSEGPRPYCIRVVRYLVEWITKFIVPRAFLELGDQPLHRLVRLLLFRSFFDGVIFARANDGCRAGPRVLLTGFPGDEGRSSESMVV